MSYTAGRPWRTIASFMIFTITLLGAQKQNANIPATINFTNGPNDTSSAVPRFYGDTAGAYVDKSATVSADNISVFFFPSGNAGLDTTSSTSRTLTLDLSSPIDVSTGISLSPFLGTKGSITVNLSQQLLNPQNGTCCQSGGLLGMGAGSTGISRIGLTFPDPQGRPYLWTIKWGSGVTNPSYTCNVLTSHNTAETWTIGNLLSNSGSCAEIDYQSTAKGKLGPVIVYGYFDLPFQFDIQKAH